MRHQSSFYHHTRQGIYTKKLKIAIPILCNAQDLCRRVVQYILKMLKQKLLNIHSYIQNMYATVTEVK